MMTGSPRRFVRLQAAMVTLLLAAAVLPSLSSATGPERPEIVDRCGDVDPGASLRPTDLNQSAFANRSAYDLRDAYILLETSTDFLLVFRVCDLPDAWTENQTVSSQIPVAVNASQPAVILVANLTVRSAQYEVRATLAHPSQGMLRDDYRLWRGNANHSLQGAVNASLDSVTVRVPKSLVGNPGLGDELTKFRAEGWFRSTRLDFAPDARPWTPDPDEDPPALILERLDGQHFYEPTYGSNYAFGTFPRSDASLRLASPDTGSVVLAGQTHAYTLFVENRAPLADQVALTLSQPPAGYAHRLSTTTVALAAGERQAVELVVSAHESKRGDLYSLVTASSTLGESAAHAFVTRFYGPDVPAPDPPQGGGPTDDPDADGSTTTSPGGSGGSPRFPISPAPGAKRPTPGLEAVLLLILAAVVAGTVRRR